MDSELENIGLPTTDVMGGPGAHPDNGRLDCENLGEFNGCMNGCENGMYL